MAKYSLKASLGFNLGIIQVGFEFGVEWGGYPAYRSNNYSALNSYFVYLDEINKLKSEVAYLRNRLAVFEDHTQPLLDYRSRDQAGFHALLEGSDQLTLSRNLSGGILSVPPIDYMGTSDLSLSSLYLYDPPAFTTRGTCTVPYCPNEAYIDNYCLDHLMVGNPLESSEPSNDLPEPIVVDYYEPSSDLPMYNLFARYPHLFSKPRITYKKCIWPGCDNWAVSGILCPDHS